MRHANRAVVTPGVVQWALERADVSTADLATALATSEASVGEWLDGSKQPTFRQARAIATRLHVPFGFLFLLEPPPENLPIPDFRTVDGASVGSISVDLRDVLLITMRKQDWLSEYLRQSGAEPVEVVGRARTGAIATEIADDIRQALDIPEGPDRSTRPDEFLRDLVRRVESLGVRVQKNGVVGNNTHRPLHVAEFRGFALSDEYAPFIFINSVDAQQAQTFTLIHELAHIWRGDTGISGGVDQGSSSVERLCNQVASAVLVPPQEFLRAWQPDLAPRDAIQAASRYFRVSRYAIAIRAFQNSLISQETLTILLDEYRQELAKPRASSEGGGGDFYRTLVSRNGRSFTGGVIEAMNRQQVLIRDAAALLDAKPSQLSRISQEISGGE